MYGSKLGTFTILTRFALILLLVSAFAGLGVSVGAIVCAKSVCKMCSLAAAFGAVSGCLSVAAVIAFLEQR